MTFVHLATGAGVYCKGTNPYILQPFSHLFNIDALFVPT